MKKRGAGKVSSSRGGAKKGDWMFVVLLVLLGIRTLFGLLASASLIFIASPFSVTALFLLVFLVYLTSFVAVLNKKKWGAALAGVVVLFDLVSAFFAGSYDAVAVGGMIVDLLVLFLAYKCYKSFN